MLLERFAFYLLVSLLASTKAPPLPFRKGEKVHNSTHLGLCNTAIIPARAVTHFRLRNNHPFHSSMTCNGSPPPPTRHLSPRAIALLLARVAHPGLAPYPSSQRPTPKRPIINKTNECAPA